MQVLKPCPFRGHLDLLESEINETRDGARVWCDHCGALGPNSETRIEAMQRWNRRDSRQLEQTDDDAVLIELDALYKRYREIEHVAVWGGSYEREQGARMELKPIVNAMFDKLLALLEARKHADHPSPSSQNAMTSRPEARAPQSEESASSEAQ